MSTDLLDYDDVGPTVVNATPQPFDAAATMPLGPAAPAERPAPRESGTVPVRRPPCVGDVLDGTWRLEAVLGAGGSAYVYAASHVLDGRRVAVKVLREEYAQEALMVERFVGDGRIARLVRHPGVVIPLHDGVTDTGIPFLVVELLDGQTLEERLTARGPLSLMEAASMAKALLDVLAATHDKAIIHRDVKPENVFLTRSGRLKLIDFGIARPPLQMAATRTLEQTVIGTPAFMSPEQARGRWAEIDARSDLWAVGATFFRAVTGRYLRTCSTAMEDLIEATEPLDSMSELAPKLPAPVGAWLDKALAFDRKDRFATAAEMSNALDHALWQREVTPAPEDAETRAIVHPPARGFPLWAVAAGALVICFGLVVPAVIFAPHGHGYVLPTVTPPPAAAPASPAPPPSAAVSR
jgi:serine/threonine protein kinase